MIIASQKRKENIAEYLLYMWQIEDIIRAYKLDIDTIDEQIVSKYNVPDDKKKEIREWYESLIDMMRREGVVESGHLQLNKNVIIDLTDLHLALLKSPKEPFYGATFFKTLPYIVELRAKTGDEPVGEIETCFNALYGILMLRLQKKEISEQTQAAMKQISTFLALLSEKYKQENGVFSPSEQEKMLLEQASGYEKAKSDETVKLNTNSAILSSIESQIDTQNKNLID